MFKVPQYLNDPLQILWFESDDLVIFLILYFCTNHLSGWSGLLCLGFCAYGYMRLKKRGGRGFLRHILYIFGLLELKNMPHSFVTQFSE